MFKFIRVPVSTVRKIFLRIFSLITTLLLVFAYDLPRKQTKISPTSNENMAFFVRVFIAYVSVHQWSRLPNEPSRQSLQLTTLTDNIVQVRFASSLDKEGARLHAIYSYTCTCVCVRIRICFQESYGTHTANVQFGTSSPILFSPLHYYFFYFSIPPFAYRLVTVTFLDIMFIYRRRSYTFIPLPPPPGDMPSAYCRNARQVSLFRVVDANITFTNCKECGLVSSIRKPAFFSHTSRSQPTRAHDGFCQCRISYKREPSPSRLEYGEVCNELAKK